MKKRTLILLSLTIFLIVFFCLTLWMIKSGAVTQVVAKAKKQVMKILVNDRESNIKPITVNGKKYIPLHFPLDKKEKTWEVSVKYDTKTDTVKIKKIIKGRKLRGDKDCHMCNGTGRCQECYPIGSGNNLQNDACPVCDGTGNCWYCNGTGKI